MDLSTLSIPDSKIKQLNNAGIGAVEDLLVFYPRKYIDRCQLTGLKNDGSESIILFHAATISYKNTHPSIVIMKGYEQTSKFPVHILWFNQSYLYQKYEELCGSDILVAGKAIYKSDGYSGCERYEFANPAVFDTAGCDGLGLYPVYRKIRGMADDYLKMCVHKAADLLGPPEESVPQSFLRDNDLISHAKMVAGLHWPASPLELEAAQKRLLWDNLLYFALRIELGRQGAAMGSPFGIPVIRTTKKIIQDLPFRLTTDQDRIIQEFFAWIRSGRRVNALVQGDVGCGKTIIAMILMVAFAENGFQTALMAPTQILAQQHYDDLKKLVEPYGMEVGFVNGQKRKKAEQRELEDAISSGRCKLIVGTQALLSSNYRFQNLALVIEDEEHKYGVMQRQALVEKAACGTHTVTMSATPIPRSLAQTVYGGYLQLYSVQTKPPGRLPVKTGIQPDINRIFKFLVQEILKRGRQAYVVCPMITSNEKMEDIAATEETFEMYKKALSPHGISVAVVTGKTKKADAQRILREFEENKISVLVSTTVIEVGVNVPNANCIVIHNAERFGLAQLHQLRGRVGRGREQAWCIMVSDQTGNERLRAMCETTDGFRIAEVDLQQRGAGDLLGSQQSGTEKHLALAVTHPSEYAVAQKTAKWILEEGISCSLLDKAIADQQGYVGGEMLAVEGNQWSP